MKVRLLYTDKTLNMTDTLPFWAETLKEDLELEKIFSVMADEDDYIFKITQNVILAPVTSSKDILHRQHVLQDCITYPEIVESLYQMLNEAIKCRKKDGWWLFSSNAANRFYGSVKTLQFYHDYLIRLRKIADENMDRFHSEGFQMLFQEIHTELDDEFLRDSKTLLDELNFKDGTMIEMHLGRDNRTCGYTLVQRNPKKFRIRWGFAPGYTLAGQDDSGAKDLSSRCNQAYFESVDVLSEAAGHIDDYFKSIRDELAFYMGALHLLNEMKSRGIPYCFPSVSQVVSRDVQNLQDLSLALRIPHCVGNDLHTEGMDLYIITGANQGGKTTFLRSMGQAQVMFQNGLFVAAQTACFPICQGIFTHFKREEDDKMNSGKLDEELQRLDRLIPMLKPGSLLLFNESFSSTNEREGSEICRQITEALKNNRIEQFHVSHLFSFSHGFFQQHLPNICFLRAERLSDGSRSFHITEGEPDRTAYGEDLYKKLMGDQ